MIRHAVTLRALAALAASLLALAACEERDPVVLSLHGETVRRSDFERHLAKVGRGLGPVAPEARAGILEAFLEERALVIEARHRGLLPAGAGAAEEPRAVARLLAESVPPLDVGEAEIADYYSTHAAELAVPETVTLRQILVGTLNEARDVRRRLARDPKAFDPIARSQSKGEEAGAGGYMGRFERGQLPAELEAAAFGLPEGATSEPVETALGYHVLRVESRQQARTPTLEEAREGIRARLARRQRAEAERAFVAGVLARAKVNHASALRPSPR
ncbi:MAG TPA: peptidylprolyl isomerase [Vicinamibacteria bacterium]|nr:peptidylprolyl isomerase [Vicinamibacteria bacterium]